MTTILLVFIFIIFIGLGLPDSLLGSAWPAIYPDLGLPVSFANFITVIVSLGTVTASAFSSKLINRFGTGKITAISTLFTAAALLGFSFSGSMLWFCLLALPLGTGAGAIDAALNNYVAVHYSSTQMSFLHCFYGVGVALSPYIMSFALSLDNDWRLGYRIVAFIQFAIAAVAFVSLPLWNKAKTAEKQRENFTPRTLSLKEMAKMPAVRTAWIMFFSTCALEFTCGTWGCTYLVSSEGMSEAAAAKFITFYYLGITAGRFISGIIAKKLKAEKIVYSGYTVVGVALILLLLPLSASVKGVALFLIGFGNGPTFPNLTYVTPINFGKEVSQSIIGTQMAACNIGILIMPPVFGFIAQYASVNAFPYYLLALFLLMLFTTLLYGKLVKKQSENKKTF